MHPTVVGVESAKMRILSMRAVLMDIKLEGWVYRAAMKRLGYN